MKNFLQALLALAILNCSSSKEVVDKNNISQFNIVSVSLITSKDKVAVNELRFYKIQSAKDGMVLMYQNYGKWNSKIQGKHQDNIDRIVWSNVKLLDNSNELFTVIVDGTETSTDYFTCFIVLDSKGKDCFSDDYHYRKQLIEFFIVKMNQIDRNPSIYKILQ